MTELGRKLCAQHRIGESRERRFTKRDQFAPELLYFSDCVLQGREPEPGPAEGLADVRVILGHVDPDHLAGFVARRAAGEPWLDVGRHDA